jgi:hypothetical protein
MEVCGMRRPLLLSLLAPLVACVATLTPAGSVVRVTANPEAVRGCRVVGEVRGSDRLQGGALADAAERNADAQLRNAAGALGANVVLLSSSSTDRSGSTVRGEAYACGAPRDSATTRGR